MKQKNKNTDAFFALVRAGLWTDADVDLNLPKNVYWEEVYKFAEEQSVLGIVLVGIERYKNLNANINVNQELLLQWIGEVQILEQQNKAMNQFIAELIERMRAAGIYTLLVKGQGVAQCYEKPLWRCCGDVDLLLSDDNYKQAKEFLVPIASEVEKEHVREKHLGMTIDDFIVELHGTLQCGLSSRIEKGLEDIKKTVFYKGKVSSWKNSGTQVFLLSTDENVVYVFTHILQHFFKEGLGLRQICDWCRLLYHYHSELDLRLLESRIKRMGLLSEWKAFGAFAVEYLGMPMESMPLYNENDNPNHNLHRKAELIKDFILEVGNMGHNRGSWLMEHDSWLSRQYVIRKAYSMGRRCGDLIRHARIFPLDSLRFFPRIMLNGLRSAVRGE